MVEYRLTDAEPRIATKIQELIDVIGDELPRIMAHRAAGSIGKRSSTA
jgi:hypothetical protein